MLSESVPSKINDKLNLGRERERESKKKKKKIGWMVGFYGISTFVGYLAQNPFIYKYSVLFKTIQFSMST